LKLKLKNESVEMVKGHYHKCSGMLDNGGRKVYQTGVEPFGTETIAVLVKPRKKQERLRTGTRSGNQGITQYRTGRSDLQGNKWG
jgi:hypothetical protein